MKHLTLHLLGLLVALFAAHTTASAQATQDEERIVRFVADRVVMEDDPTNRNYVFSLFSPDGNWKIQINYYADSMCGHFTTDDFNLKGSGHNYNYARNPNNDMVFYSFTEMDVEVIDNTTSYTLKANCLTSNRTRFIVEGTVDVAIPTDTIKADLGYANVVANPFYGIYTLSAANDDYQLEYGVVGDNILGTFYRADLLMPELTKRLTGEKITIVNATAHHTADDDGTKHFAIDLISEDLICYSLTMFNAPINVDVTAEVDIDLGTNCALQDLTDMYGCYQFGGQNDLYGVALALTPEAVESGRREWTLDDVYLPYTTVLRFSDGYRPTLHDVKATFTAEGQLATVIAHMLCLDGTLYHVRMGLELPGYIPPPVKTVELDYGRVAIVDYTKGLGTVGIGGVRAGESQMRLYLNTHKLEGEFTTDDIIPDLCDVMLADDTTLRFHDAWDVKAHITRDADDILHFDIHMLCKDTVMYHATMYLPPLRCMQDADYQLTRDEGYNLVAIAESDHTAPLSAEYTLQYSNITSPTPSDAHADRAFSFHFRHDGPGIAGEYGYSAGTLADDEYHLFIEDRTEVRVAPMAGTLSITPLEPITIHIGSQPYTTAVYNVEFHILGQNGILYNGTGTDHLICIDADSTDDDIHYVEITEPILDALHPQHINPKLINPRPRKTLDGQRVIIATPTDTGTTPRVKYSTDGTRLTPQP